MIRISRLADYGVLIMCELARDSHTLYSARQLSERTGISEPAIMKVLKLLSKSGLIESVRGPKGGYRLGHDPQDVNVLRVVRAIDGPVAVTRCAHSDGEPCQFEASCHASHGWGVVNQALQQTLERFTIRDFLAANPSQPPATSHSSHAHVESDHKEHYANAATT